MKLTMRLGKRSYDIILKRGALQHIGLLANLNRKVFIVTDSGVPPQYAQTVCAQCKEGHIHTIPQGEASKSLAMYQTLLCSMLQAGFGRGDLGRGLRQDHHRSALRFGGGFDVLYTKILRTDP